MARLRDAQPKETTGSYERLFNNAELGKLASKVQSAIIRSGNELEKIIADSVPKIPDLDSFLKQEIIQKDILLATKEQIKKSKILDLTGSEPDFMVFKGQQKICHVVELKDGHMFDTKKAGGEHESMHRFIKHNTSHIPYPIHSHFVAFNQKSQDVIWNGFKRKIARKEAMTGRQFCEELLEINYDDIVKKRQSDCSDNVDFYLSELAKIDSIRSKLLNLLKS